MHCPPEVREEENKQITSANKSRKKEKERRLDLANEPKKFDDRTIMFPLYGNKEVGVMAAFTLKALRRTFQKGDRRMVPSVTELEALGVRRFSLPTTNAAARLALSAARLAQAL
jgi:hypothetical protein